MASGNVATAVVCGAVAIGVISARFANINSKLGAEGKDTPALVADQDKAAREDKLNPKGVKPAEERKQPGGDAVPAAKEALVAAKERPATPLTCAEATKLGADSVGRRVSWVGERNISESATINRAKGTRHVFSSLGPTGAYSFDHPFVVEDPTPYQRPATPGQKPRHYTVTGTIARVQTLIAIGRGTRYNVPVLTDIEMTPIP